MNNYREILRLKNQGISQRNIASSCKHSRNTVSPVIQHAAERNVDCRLKSVFQMPTYKRSYSLKRMYLAIEGFQIVSAFIRKWPKVALTLR